MTAEQKNLGVSIETPSVDTVRVKRVTLETTVDVSLDLGVRTADLKERIETGIPFLNHMIETVAWRSCSNLAITTKCTGYDLHHTVAEDAGITVGIAARKILENKSEKGVESRGSAFGMIDEALAMSILSFEGRSRCTIADQDICIPTTVETTQSAHLAAFFEGFANGSGATLYLRFLSGKDPHHIWESAFRSFGEALRESLRDNPWRAHTTVGVKGI